MKDLAKLALPVTLSYLGIMGMNLADLYYVGQVSTESIGAVGVGNSLFTWFFIFGIGLLSAMDYTVSYAYGAGDIEGAHKSLSQGLWTAMIIGVPSAICIAIISQNLHWFGIHPAVLKPTADYLLILSWTVLPGLCFVAIRNFLQGLGVVQAPMLL